jgi:hypothetical protein
MLVFVPSGENEACMRILSAFGLLAAILVLTLAAATPASAEFFGCQDKPGQVLAVYNGTPGSYHSRNNYSRAYRSYGSSRYTDDYAAHTRYYRAGSSPAADFGSERSWHDRSRW